MKALLLACCLLTFSLAFDCLASSLQVQVYQNGKPAAKANICVGSYQERALYVLTQTNEKGYVQLSKLPEGRVVVTANNSEGGKDEIITNADFNKSIMLALPRDNTGPTCPIKK
ncbi:MAG: hypothetical protein IT292_05490 [Deltaproteobacteria bacterium]|nr:hypothetical protein [Deltaproteobacteria bacterium]